jgi:alpha-tubulin suppressor-like RCC1 family protein
MASLVVACGEDWRVRQPADAGDDSPTPANGSSDLDAATMMSGPHTWTIRGLADGRVFAFGSNDYGQLGSADGPLRPSVPIQMPGWGGVVLIAPSAYVTLGLFPDGSLLASGDASFGSLGVPASSVMQRTPSAIAGLSGVRCVAISDSPPAAFAATDEGLYYWGTDSSFLSASQGAPLLVVKGDGGRFTSLSLSSGHVAALDARGAVYTWGADSSGQLGCGSCGNQASPRLVTLP